VHNARVFLRQHVLVMFAAVSTGFAVTGTSASARHHCVVPSVKRDSLKVAETQLRVARCKAGRITGPHNGLVTVESPHPGRLEKIGAKVSLALKHQAPAPAPAPVTPAVASPTPLGIPGNWNLILDSEFNGPSLNTSLWQTGWFGRGVTAGADPNEEADCYSPGNVTLPGDNTLHLNVTAVPSTCGGYTEPYTGALITTNPDDGRGPGFQYTYGVLEARVFIPSAGTLLADWPGVWATGQSWPTDGEDDVMEGLMGLACATFHDPSDIGIHTRVCDKSITPGWHTFSSNWQPGQVTYYYDGVPIDIVSSGVTSSPMYLILDNTVRWGDPLDTTADAMQVQYVRVWQAAS